ncbi:MAG: gliding motility-associated C-terminal domain-containing protein [Bacteroidia bacterium]|nr:gliding motility-associated C-terminal domain-containing protein [Bacteroidia bacterium]
MLIGDTAVQGVSYSWQPTNGLSNPNAAQTYASPTVTTTYTLTVKNDSISGCACADSLSTDTVTIFICPPVILPDNIFIPTAFSPNGDGQNDVLLPKGNNIATFFMAIFDRWGNKVFECENINEGWDGTYKNKPCETGTYSYYANGSYEDGKAFNKKGNITLVR